MINFTVGPVQSSESVRKIGSEQVPYFRTPEFSNIMLENENLMKKMLNAPQNSRVVFLTGSGTAAMEASIMNTLTKEDKVLVVNGGSFGKRFVELCEIHEIKHDVINLDFGMQLNESILSNYNDKGYTGFLINIHETSTGVLYDTNVIRKFCKENKLFLIVDAISSFLADELDMSDIKADVVITSSQKALACPPGVSIIALSENAIKRINSNNPKCMYFDLKSSLSNGERGQTPFTPAVGILLQINQRLKDIESNGGVKFEQNRIHELANDFRTKIKELPLEICSSCPSNAVTAIHPINASAYDIFTKLKDEYGIWICPNGGDLKDKIFRVGHIGNLTVADNDKLIEALKDLHNKNYI